jgi:hypothetical protein
VPANALWPLGEMDVTDYMIDSAEDERAYAEVASILMRHDASEDIDAYDGGPLLSTFPEHVSPTIHRVLLDARSRPGDRSA